jgi:hypothetical protein
VRRGIFKVLGRDGRHVLKTKGTLTDGKHIAVTKEVGLVGGGQMVGFVDDRGVGFGQCFEGGSESTSFLIEHDMGVATGDGWQLNANGVFRFAAKRERERERENGQCERRSKRKPTVVVVVHLPTKGDTVRHGALVWDNWQGRTILAVAFDDDDLGKHDFICER